MSTIFSFCDGFRTPALGACGGVRAGPASETRHTLDSPDLPPTVSYSINQLPKFKPQLADRKPTQVAHRDGLRGRYGAVVISCEPGFARALPRGRPSPSAQGGFARPAPLPSPRKWAGRGEVT
jgi:hypothetical protein